VSASPAEKVQLTPIDKLLIGGELVGARSGATYPNLNPATEEVIGYAADAGPDDVDAAVTAARTAFDATGWSTDRALRKHCLQQLKDALDAAQDEFRNELVAESGAPVQWMANFQLATPINAMQWTIDYIDDFEWERDLGVHETAGFPSRRLVRKEAIGVVAGITPWNYPMEVMLSKIVPALAAGNTMVLKAAPDTPFSAARLGQIAHERTDLPPGVLNVLTSSDKTIGELFVTDPRVDLISFTGSTATGRRIMEIGAPTLKRLFLELGGKSAHILLDDADYEAIVPMAAMFMCGHAGQGCVLNTRLLVPRADQDRVLAIAKATFEAIKYGDPTDPENFSGPVVNRSQYERVLGYLRLGVEEGATVVTGGGPATQFDRGFYVQPTLFADVHNAMHIAREEIFGPVLVVIPYDSEDEAVAIANDSEYGLGAGVSSSDPQRALAVAKRLRAGAIGINNAPIYGPESPFGGYKASGIGRQSGREGMEQYLETKSIGVPV
jgi:aldehyde dehydrogenase (NAD+)